MHDVRAHVSYSAVQMRRERLTLHRRARAVKGTCANQRAESAIRPLCTAGGPTMSGSCTFAVPQGARPARTMNGSSSTAPHRRLLIDGCSLTAARRLLRQLLGYFSAVLSATAALCNDCLSRLLVDWHSTAAAPDGFAASEEPGRHPCQESRVQTLARTRGGERRRFWGRSRPNPMLFVRAGHQNIDAINRVVLH